MKHNKRVTKNCGNCKYYQYITNLEGKCHHNKSTWKKATPSAWHCLCEEKLWKK